MKTQLTKPLYESPIKERNEKKYGITDGNQCICCSKPLKDKDTLHVHMNTNWEAVSPTIDEKNFVELTGYESQGCFPIGNDCAKKMLGFTFPI